MPEGAGGGFSRIAGRQQQDGGAEEASGYSQPQLCPLPAQHEFHALSRVALAEGQGGRGEAPSGGEIQKALGVVAADLGTQALQHRLVAAQLHVPAAQEEAQPHQGVEPVDAHRQPEQGLDDGVPVAQVELLVEEDVFPLLVFQVRGQVDGSHQHEGRPDAVAFPDPPAQGDGFEELSF